VGASAQFQSHAGSIEAGSALLELLLPDEFQSHAGSIEAPSGVESYPGPTIVFQSHAGSIEAPVFGSHGSEWLDAFQSHAGSIEAIADLILLLMLWVVSIPRWFD